MTTEQEKWIATRGLKYEEGYFPGYPTYTIDDAADRLVQQRDEAILEFGFSILTADTVARLARHGPFLEIGSGGGYYAYELRRAGVDIIATDPRPFSGVFMRGKPKIWIEPERLTAAAAIAKYPGRTLLSVWPNGYFYRALSVYVRAGGKKVVYVGEPAYGCTDYPKLLDQGECVEVIAIPQWQGIHDFCGVYTFPRGVAAYRYFEEGK